MTIGLSLLPFFLIFIDQLIYRIDPAVHVSAAERIAPEVEDVDVSDYIAEGGSAMIVDKDLNVTLLGGKPIWNRASFSEEEWTDFLTGMDEVYAYHYDIACQSGSDGYWLVMRKPAAVTLSLALFFNPEAEDFAAVFIRFLFPFFAYFAAVAAFVIYSFKRTANEIRAGEELLRSEEEKRMLLVSEISHDLKTPLASVQGYSEMLLSKDVDAQKQREYLQSIHDNSVRSNNILRSLFMFSKLGSAGFKPDTERTDICEYTRQIIAEYIPVFEEKDFGYELEVPESELDVSIDRELFRRVYDNLIENALKYNAAGTKILIGVADKGSSVEITVADNGIGIPAEYTDKIFLPFFRADKASSKRDGSGLGLAIVRRIITLHAGDISYTGDKGGCRWLIILPLNK
ncbi:MAG: HAMP domain-containing histidine kinase [Lachnospiraceae bacterium]|nr:HAMP domain-containing histidine kinase [Lachnospiraceae bacterium]